MSASVLPDPIPNSVVKACSGDDNISARLCENTSLPYYSQRKSGDHVLANNITMEELLASQPQKLNLFHRGQEVEGKVIAIYDKEIILDLGGKSEGILPIRDIPDTQLKDLKKGSKLKAYVSMAESENGQILLSSVPQMRVNLNFKGHGINWSRFLNAQNQKSKLQGKVREVNRGGLSVEVDTARGFLPN